MFLPTNSYAGIQQSYYPTAGLLTAQSQDWELKAEEQRLYHYRDILLKSTRMKLSEGDFNKCISAVRMVLIENLWRHFLKVNKCWPSLCLSLLTYRSEHSSLIGLNIYEVREI